MENKISGISKLTVIIAGWFPLLTIIGPGMHTITQNTKIYQKYQLHHQLPDKYNEICVVESILIVKLRARKTLCVLNTNAKVTQNVNVN